MYKIDINIKKNKPWFSLKNEHCNGTYIIKCGDNIDLKNTQININYHYCGMNLTINCKEYKNNIKSSVSEEDNIAMGRLGRAYIKGKGVDKDLDLAADWMRKAAEKNKIWEKELKEIDFRLNYIS